MSYFASVQVLVQVCVRFDVSYDRVNQLQEAHVFSTTDGMALEVFVVEGWPGDEVHALAPIICLLKIS